MSPKSDNLSNSNPAGRPTGSDNTTINICTNGVDSACKSSFTPKKRERDGVDCAHKKRERERERKIQVEFELRNQPCSPTAIPAQIELMD